MAKYAVEGANVTVAYVFARLKSQESSTVHAASAMTGSVLHIMGKSAMVRIFKAM